jgi:acetolactate decarboxylase
MYSLSRSRILWLSLAIAPLLFSAEKEAERANAKHDRELFQVSTLDALSLGIYQGSLSYHDLKQHGDFGVGTFDSLDGEMVALDGRFYQVRSDGTIERVPGDATTPFAAVTTFQSDVQFIISQPTSLAQLTELIEQKLPSGNFFYAVKVHGRFEDLTTRSVPKQYVPYPPLATAISQETLFPYRNIVGTLVGFRSPGFVKGINQVGYHFHFISDDESAGGHALSWTLSQGIVEIDLLRKSSMLLPDNPAFRLAPLPLP